MGNLETRFLRKCSKIEEGFRDFTRKGPLKITLYSFLPLDPCMSIWHVFRHIGKHFILLKLWKYAKCIENQGLNKQQYCFANISTRKARIFMKFCVVVKYYLHEIRNLSYQDSMWPPHKISWRSVAEIFEKQYWCLFNPWFSMHFA